MDIFGKFFWPAVMLMSPLLNCACSSQGSSDTKLCSCSQNHKLLMAPVRFFQHELHNDLKIKMHNCFHNEHHNDLEENESKDKHNDL